MKKVNAIKHETLALKTLCRAPYGTTGLYVGDIKDSNRISARIMSYAVHAGCKLQTERYVGVNTRTGNTMVTVQATVLKRGRPLQKPGPKLGSRNNIKLAVSGDTVYHGGTI